MYDNFDIDWKKLNIPDNVKYLYIYNNNKNNKLEDIYSIEIVNYYNNINVKSLPKNLDIIKIYTKDGKIISKYGLKLNHIFYVLNIINIVLILFIVYLCYDWVKHKYSLYKYTKNE